MPDLLPQPVMLWIQQEQLQLISAESLVGGCVASVRRLWLKSNMNNELSLILKQMPGGAIEGLYAEAQGLSALRLHGKGALRVPEVLLVNDGVLLMEDLGTGIPSDDYDLRLARGLALQHQQKSEAFGFTVDTFCGGTRQPNSWQKEGVSFFVSQRLLSVAQQCLVKGLLSTADYAGLETLCNRLDEFIPAQPAVLLHGDLWSGNVHCSAAGQPALIDPAVYYGWAEADLAMTRLFGGFSQRFYDCYGEVTGIDPLWPERCDLYNLYHYLNHLLLFGGAYHSDVLRIVKYYSGHSC